MVVLVVVDVSGTLVAPLSTLLVGSWMRLLAVLSTLLVDQVATDIVGLMLMFLFPVRFLIRGIFLACSPTKNFTAVLMG